MSLWDARPKPGEYVQEERVIAGFHVRLKRRRPTFLEEVAIAATTRDKRGWPQPLLVLAEVVQLACKDVEHGIPDADGNVATWEPLDLTPARCAALAEDSELAFAFVDWLAQDTIRNVTGQTKEAVKKKPGP